ncbi:MAG TPA: adenylate/guanylate cyclase domain-containing protein, partial [Nitrososphaerales archaeon]|nr:adenylate/guanylate cyclase domain-containing protein [Nitrososphaerales archaeon]
MSQEDRRLAAIMFTDLVGYTALTQKNEAKALALLQKHAELLRPSFAKHGGREVKMIGDSFLVEFSSALDATLCAVEIQRVLYEHNVANPASKIELRIGIHAGDVVSRGEDVFGDAVNIASRIEPL